jgi:hypothetical protein
MPSRAGDARIPEPYAYVGPWTPGRAPSGTLRSVPPGPCRPRCPKSSPSSSSSVPARYGPPTITHKPERGEGGQRGMLSSRECTGR